MIHRRGWQRPRPTRRDPAPRPPFWDLQASLTPQAIRPLRTHRVSLAREEGLFAGTSTGANVYAALRLAERLGPDATVVTVMCDTGMKYLRTFGG